MYSVVEEVSPAVSLIAPRNSAALLKWSTCVPALPLPGIRIDVVASPTMDEFTMIVRVPVSEPHIHSDEPLTMESLPASVYVYPPFPLKMRPWATMRLGIVMVAPFAALSMSWLRASLPLFSRRSERPVNVQAEPVFGVRRTSPLGTMKSDTAISAAENGTVAVAEASRAQPMAAVWFVEKDVLSPGSAPIL